MPDIEFIQSGGMKDIDLVHFWFNEKRSSDDDLVVVVGAIGFEPMTLCL